MLSSLRRITRDGRWIPEIDGLRFVAIISVYLFHLSGEIEDRITPRILIKPNLWWLNQIKNNGDRGVILFFVISGMILAVPFARHYLLGAKAVSLRKYYMRRLTRLEPPYILSMIFVATLLAIYKHGLGPGWPGHLLASIFYQHNLTYGSVSTINFVTWSLEVEIQFYILAPLVMQLFRIRPTALRRAILIASIFAFGFAQLPYQSTLRFNISILNFIQYFLTGLLVADIFILDLDKMRSSYLWDLAGLASLGALFWPNHLSLWPHAVLPLAVFLLFLSAMRSHILRRFFAAPPIAVIGGMCYSIYLLHPTFLALVFKLSRRAIIPTFEYPANMLIQVLVTGIPAMIPCIAFFILVERPCMDPDWPSKLWHKLTGRSGRELEALDAHGVSK